MSDTGHRLPTLYSLVDKSQPRISFFGKNNWRTSTFMHTCHTTRSKSESKHCDNCPSNVRSLCDGVFAQMTLIYIKCSCAHCATHTKIVHECLRYLRISTVVADPLHFPYNECFRRTRKGQETHANGSMTSWNDVRFPKS